jgi:hypothetical protein
VARQRKAGKRGSISKEKELCYKCGSVFVVYLCGQYMMGASRGIFVMERHFGSSFSEGHKPEWHSGTFFHCIGITKPSIPDKILGHFLHSGAFF